MLYTAETPGEYIDQLEDDWRRRKLLELRQIIKENGPALVERIHYKMLCYGDTGTAVFHLNAQKNYVSLYVGNASKIDPDGNLLAGLNRGKSCIRFRRSDDISKTQIDKFIVRAIHLWERGSDAGC
ncbi:MAG: iron chaperone [Geminicoccales bacterium]